MTDQNTNIGFSYKFLHFLQIEGSIVHVMKALASHPSAAQSLIEDDSLHLLFQMVANGSLTVFSQYKDGLVTLHSIQLHRHAMQVTIFLKVFSYTFEGTLFLFNTILFAYQ